MKTFQTMKRKDELFFSSSFNLRKKFLKSEKFYYCSLTRTDIKVNHDYVIDKFSIVSQ